MDPSKIKLKRVAVKTNMAEGALDRPKKICLGSHSHPSIMSTFGAEGVALAIPLDLPLAIVPVLHQPTLALKTGASSSTPQPKGVEGCLHGDSIFND